ncbi:hypothetical protein AB4305_03140 [Nocardia sp. 2YAB30]|uniref:hypothetical protein n=1 Tax=unclassified Nocardia TaxID=2637762 RepID=UPI003F97DA41
METEHAASRFRIPALGQAGIALAIELAWLGVGGGSLGYITIGTVGIVALMIVTVGRIRTVNTAARIVLGLTFAGSVADRLGWLGQPGAAGVSWGSYSNFLDYTQQLTPAYVDRFVPALGLLATVMEIVLAATLILGVALRLSAITAAVVLSVFAVAMWSSLGFAAMSEYAVPVLASGAALLAVAPSGFRLDSLLPTFTRLVHALKPAQPSGPPAVRPDGSPPRE